ncbi:response regulator transcription factor [Devosia sp. ZW T5_3]|uniref:response regulator transcription factor n=1 Tax=Devosia sp. ZW T5_3 TaxID=3378085 RepID=UPI00385353C7
MSDAAVVHIVDDDDSLRRALANLFGSVGLGARTYGSAQEFLGNFDDLAPGCIVLDVRLPGKNGIALHEQMAGLGIHLPVIMITGHGDIPMSVRAMKAGALDFLPKPFRDQDLLDAVDRAIQRDLERRATEKSASELRALFASLSERERQVMMGVTSGKMNKQVAGDLHISEVTVKIYRAHAMQKMGAKTLPDLVRMAEQVKAADAKR